MLDSNGLPTTDPVQVAEAATRLGEAASRAQLDDIAESALSLSLQILKEMVKPSSDPSDSERHALLDA